MQHSMGKGFEDITRLGPNFQIHFMGIENVHVMRQSLDKLSEAIYHGGDHSNSATSFDSLLVASNWLFHCRQILQGAPHFFTNCLLVV
jgi:myotubularin-related protein 6/7/8